MKTLRLGMFGGGPGSMIGPAHRSGAAEDGLYDLVAGCFSRDPEKNAALGAKLGLDPTRVYPDFETMAAAEAARPDGVRVAAIMTPNDTHAPACRAFLSRGVHVICDKPLATSAADAVEIRDLARDKGLFCGVTHAFATLALPHEARALVGDGAVGRVRVVQLEYAVGGRATLVEATGHAGAIWRMDPAIAGPSSTVGDIGVHAHHLARFVTGLEVEAVSADIQTFVEGRIGDDNAEINLRFSGGARGHLWASAIAAGLGDGFRIRVFGDKAGLEWTLESPDQMWLRPIGEAPRLIRRADKGLSAASATLSRTVMGHPQGMLDAWANYYREAARAIARIEGETDVPAPLPIAEAADGVQGMRFVEACVASSAADGAWTTVDTDPWS